MHAHMLDSCPKFGAVWGRGCCALLGIASSFGLENLNLVGRRSGQGLSRAGTGHSHLCPLSMSLGLPATWGQQKAH